MVALDIGTKRIGMAAYVAGVVVPLPPVLRESRERAKQEVAEVLAQRNCELLVVGLPSDTVMQRRIKHFIGLLEFGGSIVFIDEDHTSTEATELLAHLPYKSRQKAHKDGRLDSLSAAKILERYLQKSL